MPGGRPKKKYSQAQRLLKIWDMLHHRGQVTIPELMREYGVNRRTVQRDLAALTESYAIEEGDRTPDHEKTFRVRPTARLETLKLTVTEMVALHMGQNMFAFTRGTQLADAMSSLYEKLQARLCARNVELRRLLPKKLYCTAGFPKTYGEADDVLNDMLTGLLDEEKVGVTYRPPGRTAYQDVIHPYTLVAHNHALYVIAHSERAGARRMYALERIQASERRKDERFAYPDDYDPSRELGPAFGISTGAAPTRVRLLFAAEVAPYVAARQWHASQVTTARADGSLEVAMEVGVTEELLHWLTGYGGAVQVLSPRKLREQVRARHREGSRASGSGS